MEVRVVRKYYKIGDWQLNPENNALFFAFMSINYVI